MCSLVTSCTYSWTHPASQPASPPTQVLGLAGARGRRVEHLGVGNLLLQGTGGRGDQEDFRRAVLRLQAAGTLLATPHNRSASLEAAAAAAFDQRPPCLQLHHCAGRLAGLAAGGAHHILGLVALRGCRAVAEQNLSRSGLWCIGHCSLSGCWAGRHSRARDSARGTAGSQ